MIGKISEGHSVKMNRKFERKFPFPPLDLPIFDLSITYSNIFE